MNQLAKEVSAEIEIRKSRFIGLLYPVLTRVEARAILADLRAQHPTAVHVCWVLMCEGDSGLDDDGEPSGTAARPMYNVLVHKELMNVLAVVVRYWGGTKLGAGGLARAYSQVISEASKLAELIPVQAMCIRRFVLPFADESAFRRLCEQTGAMVQAVEYGETGGVTMELLLQVSQADAFEHRAVDLLRGGVVVEKPEAE